MIVTQASFTPGWECQSRASNKVSRKVRVSNKTIFGRSGFSTRPFGEVRVFNKTILGGQGFQQDHFGRSGFSTRPFWEVKVFNKTIR
jgi:hypothetical protein